MCNVSFSHPCHLHHRSSLSSCSPIHVITIQPCHVQKVTVHAGVLLSDTTVSVAQWLGRGFCQMGHFQLFSMILKFSMGHFLSFYTDFYGPFSKLMGLWRMAPCLPNHWSPDVVLGERVLRMFISCPVCHGIPLTRSMFMFGKTEFRYARACSSYECFILRAMRLSNKLLGQGYVKERLKSSLRKFYGRYGDLTKQYEVPLSRMLHDILDDDHIQWHPPLIGHYTNFWPLLIWTLLPNLTFYLIVQGFHRTYATGAACQQRTLTPPDTWSCPTLGLAYVLMSRPISPELVLSPDFWISNTPRYFSFALSQT